MKILIITPYISINGLGRVAANLSRIFHSRGHEVTIFCRYDTDKKFEYSGELLTFRNIKKRSRFDLFGFAFTIKRYIAKKNFDASISIGPSNDILNVILNKNTTKKITSIHNNIDESYNYVFKALFPFVAKRSSLIVPVSKALGEVAKLRVNASLRSKIKHIVNPVNIDTNYNMIDRASEDYFICVGRVEEQKALWHAISAIKLSKKSHILYILGDGTQLTMLKELVTEYKLSDRVKFLGFIDFPLEYIASAKALVMTSLFEGLPMVLIESMMLGTPIISVDCDTGPRELITLDNKSGSYSGVLLKNKAVHWSDYQKQGRYSELDSELANTMDELDKSDYLNMSNACKEISLKFTFNSVGKDWDELLNVK